MRKYVLFTALLVFVLAAFLFVLPAMAQTGVPPVSSVPIATPTPSQLEFMAFVLTITAFFKQQFGATGKWVMGITVIVAAILWFLPDVEALFPASVYWIDKLFELIKLLLATMGTFDLAVNVGAKIATATVSNKGILSTSDSSVVK